MNLTIFGDCRDTMRDLKAQGVRVQCCVTSPPYFGLRDYGTAKWQGGDPTCAHSVGGQVQDSKAPGAIVAGVRPGVDASRCRKCGAARIDLQIGLEKTPDEYVAAMVEVFGLVRDLLTDDGVLWLNLGDSYAGSRRGGDSGTSTMHSPQPNHSKRHRDEVSDAQRLHSMAQGGGRAPVGLKPKDLIGIPWRVAFALQADGWYLRQDIIWQKPNPMPESVTDRCTKAHEYLFLLTKSERYFWDYAAMQEDATFLGPNGRQLSPYAQGFARRSPDEEVARRAARSGNKERKPASARGVPVDTSGKTAGAVAGSVPWEGFTRNRRSVWTVPTRPYSGAHFAVFPEALIEPCILAGSRPGDVVLDPFMGSGTTAQVAQRFGRQWIGCELNPEYAALQQERTAQSALVL